MLPNLCWNRNDQIFGSQKPSGAGYAKHTAFCSGSRETRQEGDAGMTGPAAETGGDGCTGDLTVYVVHSSAGGVHAHACTRTHARAHTHARTHTRAHTHRHTHGPAWERLSSGTCNLTSESLAPRPGSHISPPSPSPTPNQACF